MRAYIYKITNIRNKKCYIGQTIQDWKIRITQHKYYLKKGVHSNRKLQNAVSKWGLENFTFELIEECEDIDRFSLEIKYILENDSIKNGYNILLGNRLITNWIPKEIPFQQRKLRKFSKEEYFMIRSIQKLFGSLQRPLSRTLECNSGILCSIYHNKSYVDYSKSFDLLNIQEISGYLEEFLEFTNFSISDLQVINSQIAILIYLLKNDLGMNNQEIHLLTGLPIGRIQEVGNQTWVSEKQLFLKMSILEKVEIISLFIIYCNFHRQSVAKLQIFVERSTTILRGSRV